MEPDAQTAELYDFLYKDDARVASYYAQIFGGRLSSLERTDAERSGVEKSGSVGLAILSGELKTTQELGGESKRVIDPHDLLVIDVLAKLFSDERVSRDVSNARPGALVHAQGTLFFVDRHILEMAQPLMDHVFKAMKLDRKLAEILKPFFQKLPFPSAYLLRTEKNQQVAGTIKDAGMDEPISAHYFKHGGAGLANVHLVGVKEAAEESPRLPNTQMMGVGQQVAEALAGMLFPKEAIRVTPLALYRKCSILGTASTNPVVTAPPATTA